MRRSRSLCLLRTVMIAVASLLAVCEVRATTYYVHPGGDDDHSGTSSEQAFATIRKAGQVVRNGDVVYVGAGFYTEHVEIREVRDSTLPVQFIADSSGFFTGYAGEVVFDDSAELKVEKCNSVELYGFLFDGKVKIEWKESTGCLMQSCTYTHGDDPIKINQTGITLNGCNIVDIADWTDGFTISDSGIAIDGATSDVVIRNCTIAQCSKKGIDLKKAARVVIEDSVIRDNGDHGIKAGGDQVTQTLTIARCRITGNALDGVHTHDKLQVQILSSLIAGNGEQGFGNHGDNQPVSILNCTIAHNGLNGIEQDGELLTLKNSIVAYNGQSIDLQHGSIVRENNLYWPENGETGMGPGEFWGNPAFVGSGDYHLTGASAAIDRGEDVGVMLDAEGRRRSAGLDVDLGAYEFGAGPAEFYVHQGGNDLWDGHTPATAWRTISHAALFVSPGSIVHVGGGTYRESPFFGSVPGVNTEPTVFQADTGGGATGYPGPVVVSALLPGWWAWRFDRAHDVLIRGFQFTNVEVSPGYGALVSRSQRIVFEECLFSHSDHALLAYDSELTLSGCHFEQNQPLSLTSSACQLQLLGCTFLQNTIGPYSDHDVSFWMENTELRQQLEWAAVIVGPRSDLSSPPATPVAWLVNSTVQDNQNGLRLHNVAREEVVLDGTELRDSAGFGLGLYDCRVTLDAAAHGDWPLAGNSSGILSVDSLLTLDGYDVQGYTNGYGLVAQGGELTANDCRFSQNRYGLSAEHCDQFEATGCEFDANLEYGLVVHGAANLSSCQLHDNANGLQLNESDDLLVQLWNTQIHDNELYGVYAVDSTLVFNATTASKWQLQHNGYGVVGLRSDLTFQGFSVCDNQYAGVASSHGRLTISNSAFTGNGIGVQSDQDDFFAATDSQFSANTQWGVYLASGGSFQNCQLHDNVTGGLWLQGIQDGQVTLEDTTLVNNTTYGLFAEQCQLRFDPLTIGQWSISGSDYAFAGYESELTFADVEICGGAVSGILNQFGTLLVENVTLTGNGCGLTTSEADSCTVLGSTFTSNAQYGACVTGNATFDNCSLTQNAVGGVRLVDCQPGEVQFLNTAITDNGSQGVCAEACTLVVDAAMFAPWQVAGNPISLYGDQSDLTLDGLTLSGAGDYAVRARAGQLVLHNLTVTGNANGVFSENNTVCSVESSVFSGNQQWALTVTGPVDMLNCELTGNEGGLWLHQTTDDQVSFVNTRITDNTGYGLLASESELVFNSTRQAGCLIERNGYGIAVLNSSAALTGYTVQNNGHGFLAFASDLVVDASRFTGNEVGLYAYQNTSFVLRGSTCDNNSDWGIHLLSSAALESTAVEGNGNGIWLEGLGASDVSFSGCRVEDNAGHGVFADHCTLSFDADDQSELVVRGNASGISGHTSVLTLDGYSVSDNLEYGVAAYYGTLTLRDLSLDGNGSGLLAFELDQATVERVQLESNQDWGARVFAKADAAARVTFVDTTLAYNANGLYLFGATADSLQLQNTALCDNTTAGLSIEASVMQLNDQPARGWQIARNGEGLVVRESQLTLDTATIDDCLQYALVAYDSELRVVNCQLASRQHGVYGAGNTLLAVQRTRCLGSGADGSWGVQVVDGPAEITNALIERHENGFYFESASDATAAQLYNVTLVVDDGDGVYQRGGSLTVRNTILAAAGGRYALAVESGDASHSHNLIDGFATNFHLTAADATELFKSPRFVDAAQGDYRLSVGSPAINSGADLSSLFDVDLVGNLRPSFRRFEMGAYEYVEANGSLRILTWSEQR